MYLLDLELTSGVSKIKPKTYGYIYILLLFAITSDGYIISFITRYCKICALGSIYYAGYSIRKKYLTNQFFFHKKCYFLQIEQFNQYFILPQHKQQSTSTSTLFIFICPFVNKT